MNKLKYILIAIILLAVGILPTFCDWRAPSIAKAIPIEFREVPR